MSKADTRDLMKFLAPFDEETRSVVFWLREFIWDLYPTANELIYDNYSAVAFGWSPTDKLSHTFCSIAAFRTNYNIHFGFYWGNEIADPEKKLLGGGHQYRYVLVDDVKTFPKTYIKKLMKEAYANSLGKVKDEKQLRKGETIVKSISAAKRAIERSAPKKKNIKKAK